MYEQLIADFEKVISELEERLINDDSFADSDDFDKKYEDLKNQERKVDDQLPTFDEKMSEKQWSKFDILRTRFDKCQKRIKKIEEATDIDSEDDSSWMFPND